MGSGAGELHTASGLKTVAFMYTNLIENRIEYKRIGYCGREDKWTGYSGPEM